jgi:hypothetical protein
LAAAALLFYLDENLPAEIARQLQLRGKVMLHKTMKRAVGLVLSCVAICLTACTASDQNYLISKTSTSTPPPATATTTLSKTEPPSEPTIPTVNSDDLESSATLKPNVYPDCIAGVIILWSEYGGEVQNYAVCPDGTSLVEVSPEDSWIDQYLNYGDLRVRITDDRHGLILEDASGNPIKNLVDDVSMELNHAALSFDGKYVAYIFITEYYAQGLSIIDVETGIISTIIAPDSPDSDEDITAFSLSWISWSANSHKLLIHGRTVPVQVLTIACDDTSHICNGKVEGKAGKFVDGYSVARWSPDGTLIAYPCYTSKEVNDSIVTQQSVCIQDMRGDLLYEFEENTLGVSEIGSIQWSPDATQVAFCAYLQGQSNSDVFLLSLSDGVLVNLTSNLPGDQDLILWQP